MHLQHQVLIKKQQQKKQKSLELRHERPIHHYALTKEEGWKEEERERLEMEG